MGILAGLIPTPTNLPANTTPNQPGFTGGLQTFGGRVMQNLPLGGGFAYDALNTIFHLIGGNAGTHGPAPSLAGKALQYFNPTYQQNGSSLLPPQPGVNYPFYGGASMLAGETGLPGGGAVGGIDPRTGQPVYQPLGTLPNQPSSTASPFLPVNSETNNPPMYGGQQQAPANRFGGYQPQQSFSPIANFNSYIQGTQGAYGGNSPLQLMQALRGLPIDQNVQAAIGANSYSAPWDLASAIGAYQGGGGGNQGPYGASPNFRQA